MDIDDIALKIIQIPKRCGAAGNVSVISALKDTGYFDSHEQLSQGEIRKALTGHPRYAQDWLLYSEDKRASEGWYFKKSETGDYCVGYHAGKMGASSEKKYGDRLDACAAFIKQEIEDIRGQL